MSVYSSADSVMAPSDIEFDFDDAIINSAAYRRALAAMRHKPLSTQSEEVDGDLIDFSDGNTIRQSSPLEPDPDIIEVSQDLLGLCFSTAVCAQSFSHTAW